MKKWMGLVRVGAAAALLPMMLTQQAMAWGNVGHVMVNDLAIASLPASVPEFLRNASAIDIDGYLGPEPDRWRGQEEAELSSTQAPDHFIDMEYADFVNPLPRKRYDFIRELAKAQPAHPGIDLTPEKVGMQPWQVEEVWERLKSAMREYRGLVKAQKDTKGVELAILFYAGWLGHYVGDGSQPLHTTMQYNGWNGTNPNGYTTDHGFHSKFESTYVGANIKASDVAPLVQAARPRVINDEWVQYLDYLHHTNSLMEKTYQLEKAGAFSGAGTAEGKAFVAERIAAGAIELRDLIYSAWIRSADPAAPFKTAQ